MTDPFQEVESGKRADRPQLAAALAACGTRRAVLVIVKLDRLAGNAHFLLSVVEGTGQAGVVFCDLPTVPARLVGKFLVTQMAAVAELEAGLISQRTRAARIGFAHTQFATATCNTIRLRLLKIGAVVRISLRRISIAMTSAC